MAVLTLSDVSELVSYLIGAFALGITIGSILRVFRRGAERIG